MQPDKLATTAKKLKDSPQPTIKKLLDILLTDSFTETAKFFEDTRVGSLVDPTADKIVLSIRGTLANTLESLDYITDSAVHFSIRDWVQGQRQDSWLFLSATPNQRETLKPLMSAWLSVAVKSLMDQGEDRSRRVWFIIDELASLQRIPILMQGLSESRRFSDCFVLAFQDLNQLDTQYGMQMAKTFDSLMKTKVIFQLDSHAAKQIAGLLGEQEISESQRSISFGAHEVRDGVSVADRHYMRALVSSTDIMNQPKLLSCAH